MNQKTSRRSIRTSLLATLVAAAGIAVVAPADAVGTRRFELNSQEDFLSGDLRGVSVDSQGHVRAGWNLGTLSISAATTVFSSLSLPDGSVLLGTGNTGKVLKIAGGQVTEYADTKQLAVTSMVTDGKSVFAATLPEGKIFKIDGANSMTELPAIVGAENIFALAYDGKKNGIYAATGPNGKLFFVQPGGNAQLVFDSDEPNLVSVAVAPDGTVYTGSSGKGILFKITGPGKATVYASPNGDEVKDIQFGKKGEIYILANEMGEGKAAAIPRPPSKGAAPVRSKGHAGKGALVRIDPDGVMTEMLNRSDTHFISLALDDNGRPFVGTAVEGRVYTVDENHTSMLVADVDGRQIGALSVAGKQRYIVASDPAAFHEIRGTGGADASWTSKVLDAGLRANYGRLTWHSDGVVEFQIRSGNSNDPDSTWSDWSPSLTSPNKTAIPPGRFVQLRARFSKDSNATLHDIALPFVTDNLRAIVTSIDVQSKGGGSGLLPPSGADIPPRSSSIRLNWKVDNPDNDQLRYRVSFRFEKQLGVWRDLTKPDEVYTRSDVEWETASLPEGTYRIRVEATDEMANAPDRVTRHSLESGPILVDNTAPVFRSLRTTGKRVQAELVDGLGPIARIDFAINGRTEWRPLSPKDGIFDEAAEEIDADLSSVLGPGPHLVAIRTFDQAGNFVVRDIEVKLARLFNLPSAHAAPSFPSPYPHSFGGDTATHWSLGPGLLYSYERRPRVSSQRLRRRMS